MLSVARWVVGALLVLNILLSVVLIVLLAVTFAVEPRVLAGLAETYPGKDVRTALDAARAVLALVLPVGVAAHLIFRRLLAILDSVAAGDPFVAANGDRLRAIAWALLAIQVCDVLFGIFGSRVDLALGGGFRAGHRA